MIDQLKSLQLDERSVSLEFAASQRRSKDLIVVRDVSKSIEGKQLFSNVTLTITNGMRLGVVGVNGSGKTTFLKTLLGEVSPDTGSVQVLKNLRIRYFEQTRRSLDLSLTLKQALCTDGDQVVWNGQLIHVAGWASRFLFTRDQLGLPLSALSGGERARVLLARLMLEESDVLVFDEPTNDLDIATLEVLEESFAQFPGAIILVTHDRYLLDRVSDVIVAMGRTGGMFASVSQWLGNRRLENNWLENRGGGEGSSGSDNTCPAAPELTAEERKELRSVEREISKLEQRIATLQERASTDEVVQNPSLLEEACAKLGAAQSELDGLYERWERLESRRS
jgi:ATP-binding cassette subfamily F protein uup